MSEMPPITESFVCKWLAIYGNNFSSWNNLKWKKWNSAAICAFCRFLVRVTIVGKNKTLSLFLSYLVQRIIENGHIKAILVEILIIVIMIIVCFIWAGNNEQFRVTPSTCSG